MIKITIIKKGIISISLLMIILFITAGSLASAADFRNIYGINWRGSACENVDYAKSMGYDFVNYQNGMEKCSNSNNLGFFLEGPEGYGYPNNTLKIDLEEVYPSAFAKQLNDFFLWKSNSAFPKNLATGWFFSSKIFRPLPDFQRQEVIDAVVKGALAEVSKRENKSKNFYFAGYSWDMPGINGDLWSDYTGNGGKQITINYWTGSSSGIQHPNKTYKHSKYKDGVAAFRKELFNKTREKYPNMKLIVEPNLPYEDYISQIKDRTDAFKLKADMICEEETDFIRFNNTLKFVRDQRIFDTGLIKKENMCSATPEPYDYSLNLKIAGNAAINKAWFIWFGRLGGTGTMPDYNSIREVPARFKLIRAMVGWDNLNGAYSRSWSESKMRYNSTNSYADMTVIYSRHPKNKMVYAVVLNKDKGKIMLRPNEKVTNIYRTDGLLRKTTAALGDFGMTTSNNAIILTLKDIANQNKGYIIETN